MLVMFLTWALHNASKKPFAVLVAGKDALMHWRSSKQKGGMVCNKKRLLPSDMPAWSVVRNPIGAKGGRWLQPFLMEGTHSWQCLSVA